MSISATDLGLANRRFRQRMLVCIKIDGATEKQLRKFKADVKYGSRTFVSNFSKYFALTSRDFEVNFFSSSEYVYILVFCTDQREQMFINIFKRNFGKDPHAIQKHSGVKA
jgi:hypothetical protein